MKKITYSLVLATTIMATSCTNDDLGLNSLIPDSDKEMISFSMSDGSTPQGSRAFIAEGLTRAGFNGDYGDNHNEKTAILMHIESQKGSESVWKFTKTLAVAAPESGSAGYSTVSFNELYRRYWDDAHGRNSLLSVYAVAIPNLSTISSDAAANNAVIEEGDLSSAASGIWGTDLVTEPSHTISWTVTKAQNAETLYQQDLVYSNNIKHGGTDGLYWFYYGETADGKTKNTWQPGNSADDITPTGAETHGPGRMLFRLSNTSDPSSAGKFDRGHLKFNHALSRITINLIEGTGFDHSSSSNSDFTFDDATEANRTVNLYAMNYTGSLDLKAGTWSSTTAIEGDNPVRIAPGTKTSTSETVAEKTVYTSKYTCSAQILPDYTFTSTSTEKVLDFTIDGNTYFIENKMLWKALNDNVSNNGLTAGTSHQMKQGKNYVFNITVDKKQIESLTATLADWSDVVAANEHINNTHVEFSTYVESGAGKTEITSDLHLFRLPEDLGSINTSTQPDAHKYRGEYTDEAVAAYASSKWSTNWFFDDNKTAYHFRAINTLACVGSTSNDNHDSQEESAANKKQSNFGTAENVSIYSETRNCTYFNMHNGTTTDHDYQWGAPFITTGGTKYYEYSTTNGYENIIHKGITSTESTINLTQLHMMSQINVIVRTTDKCYGASGSETAVEASNSIALETGEVGSKTQCDVTITRLYDYGTVDMGTGLITIDKANNSDGHTSGVKATEPMTKPTAGITPNDETGSNLVEIDNKKYSTKQTGAYTFNVLPQELKRDGGETEDYYVGITIKTPDNNQYYVVKRLSQILATAVGSSQNQTTSAITRWYPNHKYTYTFTITKKGIEAITCTLADWSNVTGENTNIDLED